MGCASRLHSDSVEDNADERRNTISRMVGGLLTIESQSVDEWRAKEGCIWTRWEGFQALGLGIMIHDP